LSSRLRPKYFSLNKLKHRKLALIVGPEVKGLSSRILSRVDLILEIPMWGAKESLNVSVAFGIAIYQLKKLLLGQSFGKEKNLL